MSDLRVPKRRISVELTLRGGGTRTVDLFLAEFASEHVGSERVSDVLNGKSEFIPALTKDEGMVLLNRQAVMVATVAAAEETDEAEQHTLPTEALVRITLWDGVKLEGILTYVRPPEHSRPVDFLNEGQPFVKLHLKDRVALVHKRFIAAVALV